jgi:uncharacterized protein (TIGR03086 family)
MHTILDPRQADATAVRATVALVASISEADLGRPTPCADWDLRTLLAHMTAQHRGFAAAAVGRGADEAVWRPDPQDPISGYARSAADVITAFAPDEVLDRPFLIPEAGDRPLPGRMVIGFHLVDYVVHGWDVAAAMGLPWELPADVLEAALPIVRAVPDGDERKLPGAAFAPAVRASGATTPMDEILTLLGRSPGWRPNLS